MTAAAPPRHEARAGFRLYFITEGNGPELGRRIDLALAPLPPGLAAVQLRVKHLDGRLLLDEALHLRELTARRGASLLINDRVDVALAVGADGVHLPGRGLPVGEVRRLAPDLLVGASTHGIDEAERAFAAGAHFVTLGPIWPTPSKAGMGEPLGPEVLATAAARFGARVFALGGVDLERAKICAASGASIACVRAVFGALDPGRAACAMASVF